MRWGDLLKPKGFDGTLVWHADPLVVVHPEDGIVYAGRTEIEFRAVAGDPNVGVAKALTPGPSGWAPDLQVTCRIDRPQNASPELRHRGGFALMGTDGEGFPFTWYLNSSADEVLAAAEILEEASEEEPPTP